MGTIRRANSDAKPLRDLWPGTALLAQRGTNKVRVFREALEENLLAGLREQVMQPEVVDYVLAKFEAELTAAVDNLGGELEQMRRRKEELEREIGNLENFVARGDCSPGLRAALVDREREISEITAKMFDARPDSLQTKLRNIRALVETRMRDIRSVLNSDAAQVRAEFAKHIEKITMTPSGEHYVASGTWNLVGRGSIDGAGGQNRTGYARLFRAALYH
jgi:hypothetical protein